MSLTVERVRELILFADIGERDELPEIVLFDEDATDALAALTLLAELMPLLDELDDQDEPHDNHPTLLKLAAKARELQERKP